jgi:hypothetical protein
MHSKSDDESKAARATSQNYKYCEVMMAAIRSDAWPSHSGGTTPFRVAPVTTWLMAVRIPSTTGGTRTFVPSSVVTGRSVVVLAVMHGTPSAVVSS